MYHSSILLYVSYLSLRSAKKNDTLRLFHKKTFFVRAHTQRYIQKVSDIKSYRYKKIHHDVNFNAKK